MLSTLIMIVRTQLPALADSTIAPCNARDIRADSK